MLIFHVKWPDGTAALVGADDERHLAAILDDKGTPHAASYEIYTKQLWVDFGRIEDGNTMDELISQEVTPQRNLSSPINESGIEMHAWMLERSHPNLMKLYEDAYNEDRDISPEEVTRALEADTRHELASKFSRDVLRDYPDLNHPNEEEHPDHIGRTDWHTGAPDLEVVRGGRDDQGPESP